MGERGGGYSPEEFASRLPVENEGDDFGEEKTRPDTELVTREQEIGMTKEQRDAVIAVKAKIEELFLDERAVEGFSEDQNLDELADNVITEMKKAEMKNFIEDSKEDPAKWKKDGVISKGFWVTRGDEKYHVGLLVNENNEVALDSITQ
jgi:hypothetical protein